MDKLNEPWVVEYGWADWGLPCEHTILDENSEVVAVVPSFQCHPMGEKPERRKEARRRKELAFLLGRTPRLLKIVKDFMDRMNRFGEWDDGCFYYNKTSASELQFPIQEAQDLLKELEKEKG